MFLDTLSDDSWSQIDSLQDACKHLFETFEIPVLIDDSMNNSGEENLVCLLAQQVDQIMHLIDSIRIHSILLAPLRQELLT
jgi:hypothetical protein